MFKKKIYKVWSPILKSSYINDKVFLLSAFGNAELLINGYHGRADGN